MKKSQLFKESVLAAVGVAVYATTVAAVMNRLSQLGSQMTSFWGPAAMLLLLVLSVAVVGLLVFGRPVWWYLAGDKNGAVKLVVGTLLSLLAIITGYLILAL